MIMVKPALAYLDIISLAKANFDVPIVAYNVSGEYSLVKAAAKNGWVDEKAITNEILTGIKRAGADLIITYHAKDLKTWLNAS
jgi:porphobilinogen synthase